MTLSFIGTVHQGATAGTSVGLAAPAGRQPGDLLLAMTQPTTGSYTVSTGWVLQGTDSSGTYHFAAHAKVAAGDSTDTLTYTFGTSSDVSIDIACYRGIRFPTASTGNWADINTPGGERTLSLPAKPVGATTVIAAFLLPALVDPGYIQYGITPGFGYTEDAYDIPVTAPMWYVFWQHSLGPVNDLATTVATDTDGAGGAYWGQAFAVGPGGGLSMLV